MKKQNVYQKIEEKYANLFEKIGMATGKKERWETYQSIDKAERDRFVCDLMWQYNQASLTKLLQRFELDANGELIGQEKLKIDSDYDDLHFSSSKGFDTLVFMEIVKKSIEEYDPTKNFIACVGQNYKQEAGKRAAEGWMRGFDSDSSRVKKVYLAKLVNKVRREMEWMNNYKSIEELIEDVSKNIPYQYSKRDKEDAKILLNSLNFIYLDQKIGDSENDREITQEAFLPIEENGFSEVEKNGLATFADFLVQLAEGMEKNWDVITQVTDKINRDILKGLLTKSILIELKLDIIPEDSGIKPEPRCGQWCHNAARCPKDKKKIGCRVRYDAIQAKPPYGDGELYRFLKPKGDQLYSKLLQRDYLDAALPNSCFEDVYHEQLFPNPASVKDLQEDDDCFDFSDKRLAKVLRKDKSKISEARKKYERETVPSMLKMFLEWKEQ